jgi:beta-N-acetylhexosaminidase
MGGTVATDPGLRRLALRTLLAAFPGPTPPEWAVRLLRDGLAGYALFGYNIVDPAQVAGLTAALRAARPDVLVAVDEEGGDVTRLAQATGSPYPGNAALGVVDDPDLTRRIYRAIGADLAAVGVNLDLAPTVDVNSVDDNPIIGTRSFSADPGTAARHTAAAVAGLQTTGVAACAKHFPGHGGTIVDSHLATPTVDADLPVLRARDLPPFAAAVEAGVRAVMTAHIRVPELTGDAPATFSPAALDLLRGEYGFDGVVVTDALEMAGAATAAGGVPAAAVAALAAGADLLCLGADIDAALVERVAAAVAEAVAAGALPAARVEQAARRTAALATAATLDRPAPPEPSGLGYEIARRAVRVEGSLAGLADPLLVQLESGHSIAEGRVPWGLAPHTPGVLLVDAAQTSAERLRQRAGARPVVVVARHLHRAATARALVEKLATDHPTVVAEMGWPAAWRPVGAQAFVTTHGASHANGAALAAVLGLA